MTASIGIWAHGDRTGDVVLYRWEADEQTGFVAFEVPALKFRPADDSGRPIGDLVIDIAADESAGTADGVDQRLFSRAAVAIMRAYRRAGAAPATAHAYYH
ncbi:hypothetical protein [Actinoplanes sp. NPDC049316]|uniref:hypothetical protein n=1 Tax=Actinoplanes sp. NPDC049316 TaxID=3154727 RepID=UPI00341961FE